MYFRLETLFFHSLSPSQLTDRLPAKPTVLSPSRVSAAAAEVWNLALRLWHLTRRVSLTSHSARAECSGCGHPGKGTISCQVTSATTGCSGRLASFAVYIDIAAPTPGRVWHPAGIWRQQAWCWQPTVKCMSRQQRTFTADKITKHHNRLRYYLFLWSRKNSFFFFSCIFLK